MSKKQKQLIKDLDKENDRLAEQWASTFRELGETKASLNRTRELARRDAVDWVQDESAYIDEINELKIAIEALRRAWFDANERLQTLEPPLPCKVGDTVRLTSTGEGVRACWEGVVKDINQHELTLGDNAWTVEYAPEDTIEVL